MGYKNHYLGYVQVKKQFSTSVEAFEKKLYMSIFIYKHYTYVYTETHTFYAILDLDV